MKEQWNFRNYIAIPLEKYARKYAGGSEYDADRIECGDFVDFMLEILLVFYPAFDGIHDFRKKCIKYKGLSAREIPQEVSQELFDEFRELIAIKCAL